MNNKQQTTYVFDQYEQKLKQQLKEIQTKLDILREIKREVTLAELVNYPWAQSSCGLTTSSYGSLNAAQINPLKPGDIHSFGIFSRD